MKFYPINQHKVNLKFENNLLFLCFDVKKLEKLEGFKILLQGNVMVIDNRN